jgi:hypothetical protein
MPENKDVEYAKDYLDACYHQGIDEADYEGKTDKEIIEMAAYYMDKADSAYEAWKERDI